MRTRIELTRGGALARLILAPPEGKPPALDSAVFDELETAIAEIERDRPRLVVLQSASEKYFCVGANIKALETMDAGSIVPWVMRGHEVLNRLEDLPCPVVARVEGYALGGGLELAMACDLIFAERSAKLGQTEARLGFIPGWGGCRRLADRAGHAAAKRLFFTGEMIGAGEAKAMRLVDFCGSREELDAALDGLAESVQACSPRAIGAFKRILSDEERMARTRNAATEAFESRACLRDEDTSRRLNEFLRKRRKTEG